MRQYYLYIGEEQYGPYDSAQIREMITAGQILQDQYIWWEGVEGWQVIGNLEEFKDLFQTHSSSPPVPTVSPQEPLYRVKSGEQVLGPFTKSELEKVPLPASALVSPEGSEEWVPLSGFLAEGGSDDTGGMSGSTEGSGPKKKLTGKQKIGLAVTALLLLVAAVAAPFIYKALQPPPPADIAISSSPTPPRSSHKKYDPYPFEKTLWKEGTLLVGFVDIDQGDGIFIRTPNDKRIVIDSGKGLNKAKYSYTDWGQKMVEYLEAQGIRKVDILVGSHPDFDHIGGLVTVARKVPFDLYVDAKPVGITEPTYEELLGIVKSTGARYQPMLRGDKPSWDKDCEFLVLHPKELREGMGANDMSIVIKLTFKDVSFLFTGDVEKPSEREMVRYVQSYLKSTVLKAGHHGSKTSSTRPFLQAVDPEYVVIQCGYKNHFGHPVQSVLDRYHEILKKKHEVPENYLFRNDMQGTIEFYTDGKTITVRTEKKTDPSVIFKYVDPFVNKTGKKINVNKASASELAKIPKVGPSTAQNIVEYRRKNGPFKKIEDLMKVKRIGKKTFQRLKTWVSVEDE